ncbi:winged helix-turn-helix domain-containing protein [Streptomyces sp. NBC_00233]|nr:winged helix-turn-helix domain-containing protein [Streptomyces sp. NBC_00233]MCX5233291.1 winged helix-turn-helix domain-containing protein [Streptomyces sp. NBC_00233]
MKNLYAHLACSLLTSARGVATLIGRKFHVSCSVSGATGLMHRPGFSP